MRERVGFCSYFYYFVLKKKKVDKRLQVSTCSQNLNSERSRFWFKRLKGNLVRGRAGICDSEKHALLDCWLSLPDLAVHWNEKSLPSCYFLCLLSQIAFVTYAINLIAKSSLVSFNIYQSFGNSAALMLSPARLFSDMCYFPIKAKALLEDGIMGFHPFRSLTNTDKPGSNSR